MTDEQIRPRSKPAIFEFWKWLPAVVAVLIGCAAVLFVQNPHDRIVIAVSAVVAAALWALAALRFSRRFGEQRAPESSGIALLRAAFTVSFGWLSLFLLSPQPALLERLAQASLGFTAALALWFILFGSRGYITSRRR